MAVTFESMERRMPKIEKCLAEYGITNRDLPTMIEKHFDKKAVLNHVEKCLVKVFGKMITLKYKIVNQ